MSAATVATGGLTSTTAPGKIFMTRDELAQHYKSDWHKYNLKRREAGLPMLGEMDFQARLEAALALRKEREQQQERSGKDHLKYKNKKDKKGKKHGQKLGTGAGAGASVKSSVASYERIKEQQQQKQEEEQQQSFPAVAAGAAKGEMDVDDDDDDDDDETMSNAVSKQSGSVDSDQTPPEINPLQCLFDKHVSSSLEANLERMQRKYGFFVPDQEYLVDKEGLLGYCQEKIKLGHYCLYCQRIFSTWQGCQKHMISTRHTKMRYERGIDLEEFDPFYDFSEADADFLGRTKASASAETGDEKRDFSKKLSSGDDDDDDDEDWEDISDDDELMDDVDNEDELEDDDGDDGNGLYAGYEDEIASFGFDVTPLGELVFPDGRIIGHRGLQRYYKQRFRPANERTAVVAARAAAGERLYQGRVYNINANDGGTANESALATARMGGGGLAGAPAPHGRAGNGILVPSSGGSYTAISLYRYRAVVKKSRREEARGRRLEQRTSTNINRMDKKHNRLRNGVSVAHAAR